MSDLQTEEVLISDQSPALADMRSQVLAGLRRAPKALPSLFLYDDDGLALFNQICETPEYYPTRTEIGILEAQHDTLRKLIPAGASVIAPGAGAGIKTRLLLESLDEPSSYVAIDISNEHLVASAHEINEAFPELAVVSVCADFTKEVDLPLDQLGDAFRLVYFPGSTIGNFEPDAALALLKELGHLLGEKGGILIGADLVKDAPTLEAAYDDAAGVSAAFAMNYLTRMNNELEADFDLSKWSYKAWFDDEHARIVMSLESQTLQTVSISGEPITFKAGERVRTEHSYKFTEASFAELAAKAGLKVEHVWTDPQRLFSIQYLKKA
jgi:dimethylhistidine N-methyltransferase